MRKPEFKNPCGHCHNAEALENTVWCLTCIDVLSSIEIVEATAGATMTTEELQDHLLGFIDGRMEEIQALMEEIQALDETVAELSGALEKLLKFARDEMDIPHWDWFKPTEERAIAALQKARGE